MTVALGTTLINLGIHTLLKTGAVWDRIEDARVNGEDIFIGAIVTRKSETYPDIDLCGVYEAMFGIVIGLNTNKHTLPEQGAWYNDYDHCFADDKWVRVGIPSPQGVYLVLSDTDKTFTVGMKLKVVDGLLQKAYTADNFQFICEKAVTGAANTRKYFYARYVKA